MTATTAGDFADLHGRDLAEIQSLRTQLAEEKGRTAAALGRAARAEHKVTTLTETCAGLRAQLPAWRRK